MAKKKTSLHKSKLYVPLKHHKIQENSKKPTIATKAYEPSIPPIQDYPSIFQLSWSGPTPSRFIQVTCGKSACRSVGKGLGGGVQKDRRLEVVIRKHKKVVSLS